MVPRSRTIASVVAVLLLSVVTGELPVVGAVAVETPKSDPAANYRALLDDPGVWKVWLDGVHRPTLDRATGQVGAPTAWQAGYTGRGVKVAVLDTGVDEDHPDLIGHGTPTASERSANGMGAFARTVAPHMYRRQTLSNYCCADRVMERPSKRRCLHPYGWIASKSWGASTYPVHRRDRG